MDVRGAPLGLVVAAVALPLLLLPVYWIRNVRWTEIAELSTDTFAVIRRVARERPDVGLLVFRDDTSTRRSFANTYDALLPVAVARFRSDPDHGTRRASCQGHVLVE